MNYETGNARAATIMGSDEGKQFPRLARLLAQRTEIALELVAEILVAAKVDTMRRDAR